MRESNWLRHISDTDTGLVTERENVPGLRGGVSLECPGLSLAWELRDSNRDCAVFDPVERARDLFKALDVVGDGTVTEEVHHRLSQGDDIWET